MLAVASISARLLAEIAAEEGHGVVALDLFGDDDTRRASGQWLRIGPASSMRIDGARLLETLAGLAARREVDGWVIGSGFEGLPDLLAEADTLLPRWGTAAADMRRVRNPQIFFSALDRHGIAHPDVQHAALVDATGWLIKDAGGCGGWQVRAASAGTAPPPGQYFQRQVQGTPMSATFVANGHDAVVLGINQQLVRAIGARPYVFCGVVGPLALPAALADRVDLAGRALAAEFQLQGLGSLDFMLDGATFTVLEVNPRPPASVALYRDRQPMCAHLRACRDGELPVRESWPKVHGTEIVFARQPLRLGRAAARELAAQAQCHDLPRAGSVFAIGDPLCSVSAQGGSAEAVVALLAQRRDAVLARSETST